jgi:hypothetical protein
MAAAQRSFKQIPTHFPMYRSVLNTTWIYPINNIQDALKISTNYTSFDGTNIIVPSISNFIALAYEIWYQTSLSQPINNAGYSCGVGTLFQDFGKTIEFKLPGGEVIARWALIKQLSPQTTPPIPTPGDSPNGTIGYIYIFGAYGTSTDIGSSDVDTMLVVRV